MKNTPATTIIWLLHREQLRSLDSHLSDRFWAPSNTCTTDVNTFSRFSDLISYSIAVLQNACLTSPRTRIQDLGPGMGCYNHKHSPKILKPFELPTIDV